MLFSTPMAAPRLRFRSLRHSFRNSSARALVSPSGGVYGNPADLDVFRKIAEGTDTLLIEDASHALGALGEGKPVGSLGDSGYVRMQGVRRSLELRLALPQPTMPISMTGRWPAGTSQRSPSLSVDLLTVAPQRDSANERGPSHRKERATEGAGDGTRTRDIQLGRLALCQLSYSRSVLSLVQYIAQLTVGSTGIGSISGYCALSAYCKF